MQHFLALKYVVSLTQNESKTFNGIEFNTGPSSATYHNVFIEEFMARTVCSQNGSQSSQCGEVNGWAICVSEQSSSFYHKFSL